MKFQVFRNSTVETLFSDLDISYAGYDVISVIDPGADNYLWFYLLPLKSDNQIIIAEIEAIYQRLEYVIEQIPTSKTFFVFTLAPIYTNLIETGNFDLFQKVEWYNNNIINLGNAFTNVRIIDLRSFISNYRQDELIDWKYYYLSGIILNPKLAVDFRNWFRNELNAISYNRKKCLVIDLDNTIWGGILGEDGMSGIKMGGDYPGNAFLDFQRSILELHKSGIILAICSKNNESDILELWEQNNEILIHREYVSAYRINWNAKSQNISELAHQLNIGIDSMVFLDDNPSERELVKQHLPELEVPEFPARPYMLPTFIKNVTDKYFRTYKVTQEDKHKSDQYNENELRKSFATKFSDISDYVANLEIVIDIQKANDSALPRLAQLTQKTNQFNLTTKRYNESELQGFLANENWIYYISVRDRFGDYGITGLSIINLNQEKKSASIDTFLLSCRILGKGIEEAFLNQILNKLKDSGFLTVSAYYYKSRKNEQVEFFYDKLGFKANIVSVVPEKESKEYHADLTVMNFETKPYYKITNDRNN